MKRFKIIFSTTVLVAACTVFLQAQDLNTAIEAYNLGATAAQEGNYITAIEHLDRAMEVGSALGEEVSREGAGNAGLRGVMAFPRDLRAFA